MGRARRGARRRRGRRWDLSAIRWTALEKATGTASPRRREAVSRSPLKPHAEWLKTLVAKEPFLTLAELQRRILEGLGLAFMERSIRRFFARHRTSFKKSRARQRA